ncbi:hypothetical protein [Nostoc sp. 'Peltigera malacea cyanobiont' DB3992]|uniref:hypothetical protein n=1 Tax=Nostoc sp. 'Peltigera malacea cyanobiont' DB3992 TaxID=1206980 RepID=UPI0015D52270|nr:hypothetical protein [Nostoc sp. 'Peltigera malacea cyanobiont' DB3992]
MSYQVRLITYDMSLRVERSNHFGCDYFTPLSLRTLRNAKGERNDKYLAGHDISSRNIG